MTWKDLLSQNVIACVRIDSKASQGRSCVTDQTGSHGSHVLGGDAMMYRRSSGRLIQQLLEPVDAGSGPGLDRPRRDGVNPDAFGTELAGHVAHGAFERCLDRQGQCLAMDM